MKDEYSESLVNRIMEWRQRSFTLGYMVKDEPDFSVIEPIAYANMVEGRLIEHGYKLPEDDIS